MSGRKASRDTQWIRDAFDRHEGPLVRYAMRLTGDLELARDVVQDTFLRLCRQPRDRVDRHLAAWLFTVCRRRALDVMKKQSRVRSLDAAPDREPASQPTQEAILERRESAAHILALLETLPLREQEVVRLKLQNELSYREIGEVTGLSVSNVGYLIHTAIRKVRAMTKRESEAVRKE